ncbi:uncharacterized protein IL334_004956 [Kwoniella shivajii]|uniref:C3H1-type domain-containing protein n=1 Tax=Kwoniella shivajii TaxID=564305 RepID=A0ABZ1D288_9TREE|nr:hypothetical protein IL334_004956 [Kwoniella shivajii]
MTVPTTLRPSSSMGSNTEETILIDLDSPPRSPPSISRTKTTSLLPRFDFNQTSLVPLTSRIANSTSTQTSTGVSASSNRTSIESTEDQDVRAEVQEELQSTPQLSNPITILTSTPPRVRQSSTSSSSGTSKASLSANATPFTFTKRPRQLSIVRTRSPPSFDFDDKDHHTPYTSHKANYRPATPITDANIRYEQGQSLPPYPYTSSPPYGEWNLQVNPYDHSIKIREPVSARPSKAVKITSPTQIPLPHTPEPQDDKPLRERRGKAEILSLYSNPTTIGPSTIGEPANVGNTSVYNHSSSPRSEEIFPALSSFPFSSSEHQSNDTAANSRNSGNTVLKNQIPVASSHTSTILTQRYPFTFAPFSPRRIPLPETPSVPNFVSSNTHSHTRSKETAQEIVEALKNLQIAWDKKKEAENLFKVGLDEVIHVIGHQARGHICMEDSLGSPEAPLEERTRTKILRLQEERLVLKSQLQQMNEAHVLAKERILALQASNQAKTEELDEAYKQFGHYKAQADVTKSKLHEIIAQQHELEISKLHIKKENGKLAKVCKKLLKEKNNWQETVAESKAQSELSNPAESLTSNPEAPPFVVVLLEGHPRMFEYSVMKRGAEGGRQVAKDLLEAVRNSCRTQNLNTNIIIVHLFLDIYSTMKQLQVVGCIRDLGHFHSFLDEFASESDLFSVTDSEGPDGPANKVKEHLKLYASIPSCKMTLLGTSEGQDYVKLLELMSAKGLGDKLFAIQSANNTLNDTLTTLGPAHLIKVNNYFNWNREEWKTVYRERKIGSNISNAPSVISRASSVASYSTARPVSPGSDDDFPPTSQTRIRSTASMSYLPSWDRPSTRLAPPSDFVSVIDRRYELSPMSTPRATRTGVTARTVTSPSLRGNTRQNKIVVPIDPEIDGVIGDSPPESDEDDPSVQLPHSAVKRVQRPTPIHESDSEEEGHGLPGGFRRHSSTKKESLPKRSAPVRPNTTPAPWDRKLPPRTWHDIIGKHTQNSYPTSSSGVNTIPLGGSHSRQASTTSTQPEDHMFDVHDSLCRESRDTPEYLFLKTLDPRPCHHHFLEGRCLKPDCTFTHLVPLSPSEFALLRRLAKEMNCDVVKPGTCQKSEQDCIYSHRSL